MLAAILSIALLGAPAETSSASASVKNPSSARPIHEITSEVRAALQAESGATARVDRLDGVLQLIRLCDELTHHERLDRSPALKRLRGVVVSRLRRVKRSIERDNKRQPNNEAPDSIDEISGIVAAQAGNPGRAAVPPAAPAALGQVRDFGPDLVRLIERTISPSSWDVNGGPSTIVYYAPLRALVVRAPSEVHGRVSPLLRGLRRAGE